MELDFPFGGAKLTGPAITAGILEYDWCLEFKLQPERFLQHVRRSLLLFEGRVNSLVGFYILS